MTEKKMSASERLLAKTQRTSNVAANYMSPAPSGIAKPPVTMPGQLGAFRLEAQKYADRIKELEAQVLQQELPVADLHEVQGRRRKLSEAEFQELRENLRRNPLVTPITVRQNEQGGFEIVSGHNRVRAYRELGKTTIPAVVQTSDKTQANINAFYANLLQTDLSDYEKFVGFRMMQEKLKLTPAKIAEHSGKSESFVSRLMGFADLPDAALDIIEERPSMIGMEAAHQLAMIARNAPDIETTRRIVMALEQLHLGELDQQQAVRYARGMETSRAAVLSKPIKVKVGKADYCALRRVNKSLRIDFKSAEDAATLEKAVLELLEAHADRLRAGK
jgi:ParB family chromosome partitioning protein